MSGSGEAAKQVPQQSYPQRIHTVNNFLPFSFRRAVLQTAPERRKAGAEGGLDRSRKIINSVDKLPLDVHNL